MIPDDAMIYRYPMCSGRESDFRNCQLPRSDSNSTCPAIGVVNCTEGTNILWLSNQLINTCPVHAVISRCYSDGRFRLTNSTTTVFDDDSIAVMGRIEVCDDFTYNSICYQYWDPTDAQVFCEDYMRTYYRRQYQDLTKICKESTPR